MTDNSTLTSCLFHTGTWTEVSWVKVFIVHVCPLGFGVHVLCVLRFYSLLFVCK